MPPKDPRGTPLVQGTLDVMILRVLSSGPQHGYGIARWIRQRSDEVLTVEEGSLYPALHRLEKRGLIVASWGTSEQNRRAKFYRLSAKGTRALKKELESWRRLSTAVARVLGLDPEGAPAS